MILGVVGPSPLCSAKETLRCWNEALALALLSRVNTQGGWPFRQKFDSIRVTASLSRFEV